MTELDRVLEFKTRDAIRQKNLQTGSGSNPIHKTLVKGLSIPLAHGYSIPSDGTTFAYII